MEARTSDIAPIRLGGIINNEPSMIEGGEGWHHPVDGELVGKTMDEAQPQSMAEVMSDRGQVMNNITPYKGPMPLAKDGFPRKYKKCGM